MGYQRCSTGFHNFVTGKPITHGRSPRPRHNWAGAVNFSQWWSRRWLPLPEFSRPARKC
jgi:hypothetical protein